MTVLSAEKLRERLDAKDASRLFIAPLLDPGEQLRPGQAAIDVRLGGEFDIPVPVLHPEIDPLRGYSPARMYRRMYAPLGGKIVIHPHQFLLGTTIEYLRFPSDLMAYVVGRSSWGRCGLIVATAVGIHPGFAGVLTLELRNLGELPLVLRPGDVVAQLFVHDVAVTSNAAAQQSQFVGSTAPALGSVQPGGTRRKLEALERQLEKYRGH